MIEEKSVELTNRFGKLFIPILNFLGLFFIIVLFLFVLHLRDQLVQVKGIKCTFNISKEIPFTDCNDIKWAPEWLTSFDQFLNPRDQLKKISKEGGRYLINLISNGFIYWILFGLLFSRIFKKSYLLIVKSLYVTDEIPVRDKPLDENIIKLFGKNIYSHIKHIALLVIFFANIISLPSVRLLAHFIWHSASFRYFGYLRPNVIYEQAQIYIETKLFHPGYNKEKVWKEYVKRAESFHFSKGDKKFVTIECKSCFDITGKNKDIERYFEAQQSANENGHQPSFLSPLKLASGFLAPTYLVSGSLAEYEEDWTKIIEAYQSKIDYLENIEYPKNEQRPDPLYHLPELRKLQSFIWDCWVQWGPSVPICESDKWKEDKNSDKLKKEKNIVALQFGYGDEGNSLPICYQNSKATKWYEFDDWREKVSATDDKGKPIGIQPFIKQAINEEDKKYHQQEKNAGAAWPVKVEGALHWIARDDTFCKAQQSSDHEMVFVASSIDAHIHKKNTKGLLFYSAYIWVMIAICKEDGTLLLSLPKKNNNGEEGESKAGTIEDKRWMGLIPFFQHGNIADASVYEDIKQELAVKSVDAILHQIKKVKETKEDLGNAKDLRFTYVAAFDDNGDGAPNLVHYPGTPILTLLQTELDNRIKKDQALRKILNESDNQIKKEELLDDETANRFRLKPEDRSELNITASDIPEIVQAYLTWIGNVTSGDN